MPCIYKIQNKQNGKVYIGQTFYNLEWRLNNNFCGHFKRAFKDSVIQSKLYAALRKYGKEGFIFETIEEMECSENASYDAIKDWLNRREQYWIDYYDSINSGYNMLKGNKGYGGWSKEARQKWSIKMKELWANQELRGKLKEAVNNTYATGLPQKKISNAVKMAHKNHPEIIEKIREKSKNSKWMYRIVNGKEQRTFVKINEIDAKLKEGWILGLSPTAKQSFCYNQLNKPRTEEEKAKISKTLTGKKKTKEHAKHISEGLKGKKYTDIVKKNISEATKKAMARPEVKEKISAGLRNRVWVNNGKINKTVKDYEVNNYLALGFVKGKIPCNRCWVNNGVIGKQVKAVELQSYLANGFVKGMLKNENKENQ